MVEGMVSVFLDFVPLGPHTRCFSQDPRFSKTVRPYTALDVAKMRGTVDIKYVSDDMGKKLVSSHHTIMPVNPTARADSCCLHLPLSLLLAIVLFA